MSTLVQGAVSSTRDWSDSARRLLARAATSWFVVAALGQLLFAYYIMMLYGTSALRGDWAAWNRVMPRGWNAGDTVGNAAILVHLLFAFVVTFGGMLQLVPALRSRMPAFHRWNGRVYLIAGVFAALGGTYLIWVRGTVGDVWQHFGTTFNGLLIVWFAAMAWRNARAGDYATHRRWAIRLFLAMSGVWFFRVGLMLWLMLFQRPVGFDSKTFTGPFLTFLTFAQTLLPLLLAECYFRAQKSRSPRVQFAVAALLLIATVATAAGIFGAFMGMWKPRL